MKLQQVSDNCFAALNEKNRVCDANSGLINLGGGVVIDTQSDLRHGRRMIELFGKVWEGMPRRVINTHEDGDHVWGNQLFKGAEIIAHRTVKELMPRVADPKETQQLITGADRFLSRLLLKALHPGALAVARQLKQDYDFDGIRLVLPTTVFEERHVLDLDGTEVHLTYVGPCHQIGDTIVHVPKERVVFAGDVIFRECTPMGWSGSYEKWLKTLDLIIFLDPDVIVPGHGPVCGIEGAMEMKAYLEYVREESQRCFGQGLSALEAAKKIDFGPYGGWRAPARLYMNVERAYREFGHEATDTAWDHARSSTPSSPWPRPRASRSSFDTTTFNFRRSNIMKMEQVSEHCFAVLNEKNLVCDANSGFINLGGGVVVDTQSDLPHARQMIGLFGKVWKAMPKQVINTHEDGDHVWGNQLFEGAEIIAHRTVKELMPHVADPKETQDLIAKANNVAMRLILKGLHPGALAIAEQLHQDYDFEGIQLVLPTTVFEDRHVLNLDGTEVHLIYVGPCHQTGDTLIHVPSEGVVFTGDVIFHECTPMGWNGSYEKWMKNLDFIISLKPKVIVPGHGPVCGVEGVVQMKAYLEYVRGEAMRCFGLGMSALDASKKIDFGPYAEWRAPARIFMNVERAYREFRNEAGDAPWDHAKTFDAIYHVAKARGLHLEF